MATRLFLRVLKIFARCGLIAAVLGIVVLPVQTASLLDLAIAPAHAASAGLSDPGAKAIAVAPAEKHKITRRAERSRARPLWNELSPAQHKALEPLAGEWNNLSETQKRKWIAVGKNYDRMPPSEQQRLHDRMDAWIALSPQQRQTARFNYAGTKRMKRDEKQEKWQAYQALSPGDREKFIEHAAGPPRGAAVAVKPVPQQKMPKVPTTEPDRVSRPRIAAPNEIDPNTLLPLRGSARRPTSTQVPSDSRP